MASSSRYSTPTEKQNGGSKDAVTVLEVANPDGASKVPDKERQSEAKVGGAVTDLIQGALLPCVPVIIVSVALLTLILRNRVHLDAGWQMLQAPINDDVWDSNLKDWIITFASTGGRDAYLVRYNPAALAAIASWTSKIIPLITGASMGVIAFFAGRRILDATKDDTPDQLPTPHQTSILIKVLQAHTPKSLGDVILYRWKNHERLVQPVPLVFGALSSILFMTLLIGAIDTWFATSLRPMNVPLLQRHNVSSYSFGRDFDPSQCGASRNLEQYACPSNASASCEYPCSIETWNYTHEGTTWMKQGIKGAQQAAETLLGSSPVNTIYNYSSHDTQEYFFLSDGALGQNLDFLANTTSVTTQCMLMTQDCQIDPDGPGFSCPGYSSPSFTYPGQVGVDPEMAMASSNMSMTGIQFFKDPDHQNPIGLGNKTTKLFGLQNPMHFLTWSKGFPPIDTSSDVFSNMTNGNYLQLVNGDNVFILNCTSTIYRTVYAWVNGTILHGQEDRNQGFYTSLAPPAYGAIFSAPFAIDSALGHLALQGAAALAAYKTAPQDVADKFSSEFSRAAVALSAGIHTPTLNMLEQSRNNTELLTRVPKIPLFFLIGLQAFYALASIFVALLAWMLTRPREAQQVKSRLTVDGLAAAFFEGRECQERPVGDVEELYSEHWRSEKGEQGGGQKRVHKVGIKRTETGGWVWVADGRAKGGRMDGEEEGRGRNEDSGEVHGSEAEEKRREALGRGL